MSVPEIVSCPVPQSKSTDMKTTWLWLTEGHELYAQFWMKVGLPAVPLVTEGQAEVPSGPIAA
jgi:hypothetical protein